MVSGIDVEYWYHFLHLFQHSCVSGNPSISLVQILDVKFTFSFFWFLIIIEPCSWYRCNNYSISMVLLSFTNKTRGICCYFRIILCMTAFLHFLQARFVHNFCFEQILNFAISQSYFPLFNTCTSSTFHLLFTLFLMVCVHFLLSSHRLVNYYFTYIYSYFIVTEFISIQPNYAADYLYEM